ncbi:hypothetical protein Pan44_47890 [Caulifigura coniformis]|uniref:Uncharacterized protein n=1 Tax=Caulifigura coniformis TaxID=2527983 RepID=A0A517SKS3_9PLAN|nr:hypothetical protein [Caulifigura coniformis]QDT56729.1 hypothetical protein Pan44_47890 [Caulifigura coniformis]
MRQFRLATGVVALAMAAGGCGGNSSPDRTSTKVLRPEEVKISLGKEPAPAPAAEESSSTPAGSPEASAP